MTRAFKIYNSLGYAIDILADLNTFGYSPEGLGVQFDNTTVNDGASFLLTKQELAMTDFKIKISFGAIDHKAYQAYSDFINLLNYPPYTLEYTTSIGSWKREVYLNELTKTELTVEDTLQEEFSAQPVTPWYRETTAESGLSDTQDGDGKIYIGNDFKNRIFEGVPTSGYRKGDLWHNVETPYFYVGGGTNLLTNSRGKFQPNKSITDNWVIYTNLTVYMTQGQQYTVHADASPGLVWSGTHAPGVESNNVVLWLVADFTQTVASIISDANTGTGTTFTWNKPSGTYYLRVNTYKPDSSGYAENVMIEQGTVAHPWSPAIEDSELGYYKALTDNSSFLFSDWTFIGASISDLTYNSAYDYVYQNNSGSGKLGSTKSSGYVYDYIYEETPQNGGGVFGLKNNSIYMGIKTGSPLTITIYGPSTNPYWQVIQNSQVVATDGFNIVIPEDSRLEVSSNPRDQYAYLISADGTKAKAYPMQDLTRDNFVKAPIGQSTLAVYNAKRVKIVLREERLTV